MSCLFYMLCIVSIRSGLATITTTNTSFPRTSYTYYLDSGLPSTWYNNNSVIMEGWRMRVFLLIQDPSRSSGYYCGFYSKGSSKLFSFSIVAVRGGRQKQHDVVWSTKRDYVVSENASLQLTRAEGLVLKDSDGSRVWWAYNRSDKPVVGLNLTEAGNLVLFDKAGAIIWQSFDHPRSPWVDRHRKALAAIISAGGFSIIVMALICFVMLRKQQEVDLDEYLKQVPGIPSRFSYEVLETATENFKEPLGSGGFGSVYKGVLADGTQIAVKRLNKLSKGMREFLAEVETIGSLHHFNLVRLVGFCAEKSCRLLVYEYMVNGSLDSWIFVRDREHSLDWKTRKKIILGVAKGLAYLHEECRQKIIHLDIKPHNILLDENFNAKVSDFGLSTLIDRDKSQVLTTMRGTPGYLAPEWRQLTVTVKVDVYSFGIVLLEIVCKRRNVESSRSESGFHLLKLLQKKAKDDQLIDIVEDLDEDMEKNREEVVKMIRIGAWCLQDDHNKRPLMSTVVKVLEGVMEVDPNISYAFSHAMMTSAAVIANNHVTLAPQASTLSAPR